MQICKTRYSSEVSYTLMHQQKIINRMTFKVTEYPYKKEALRDQLN